jgi:hypothetical protein
MASTVNMGLISRLKNFETLFFSALPSHCDGCGQNFSVQHALECKKGGNVISRHNEIRDELADLATKSIRSSAIRNEP